MVDLQVFSSAPNTPHVATSAIRLDSVSDFINFWHGAFGSPSLSTFIPAVEKGFINIPGLTAKKIRRHAPNPLATPAGHLDATRQGIRSTKKSYTPSAPSPQETSDSTPLKKERRIFYQVEEVLSTRSGRTHSDAAGPFPVRAHSGAIYQIIFYSEDLNFIHIETTKSRSGADLLAALQRAVKFFSDRGASPSLIHQLKSDSTTTNVKIVRMDNECSELTKAWLATTDITLELTPVAQHRSNKAERAIRTWKNHFLATLAGIDPECPLSLWENFIEQAELTLNLMRESPASSTMSAFESLCGKFDVNATPIAPLGMKVLVHDTPENRGTWQAHGKPGFYTGRALQHYRCHTVWMSDSRATRISDCLSWHPVLLKMPGSSPLEELTAVIEDAKRVLTKLLVNPLSARTKNT
jgi:hypothetical protein